MSMKWVLAIGVGLVAAGLPEVSRILLKGLVVKLLEIALKTKERVGRWAALEAERLDDMLAEARSTAEPNVARTNGAANKPGAKGQSGNGRRRTRPVKREMQA